MHYLRELKRTGVLQSDLVCMYLTLVHTVVEYVCQVWSTGLTKEQSQTLESIQKRALRIISPNETHEDGVALSVPTLKEISANYFLMLCLTQTIDFTTY